MTDWMAASRSHLSRRAVLKAGAASAAALAGLRINPALARTPPVGELLRDLAAPSRALRQPGSLPNPGLPPGTNTLPQIEHILVVMMENHSFDNILGLLARGDGLPLRHGVPLATNPDGAGELIRSFHMPTPCQLQGHPSQNWNASHVQWDQGRNDGFVRSPSGPVAMGYWTAEDMPFTNGLASVYPLADRWFSSTLCQTDPNRRYLLGGTSLGMVNDDLNFDEPPNGTIIEQLEAHGITWRNYFSSLPSVLVWTYLAKQPSTARNLVSIDQFFRDAQAGTLPGFAVIDPDFNKSSEEDPQDIQYGDQFLAQIVNAVTSGPAWPKTLLVWCYDEHGGYYDHVPPPPAVTPDDVPPAIQVPPDQPGGFDRYGFRVPAGVVSPYGRAHHVSHTVYDHTSVLKLVETKWNLPALTFRDANANDLLDMVNLHHAAFLDPAPLPSPANPDLLSSCLTTGPGQIPPADAIITS
jgi:phospholipase C